MRIDWNSEALNATHLLTSPNPIERIQGQVLQILRNDSSNVKTGDQLFIELAQELLQELVLEELSSTIGQNINSTTLSTIEKHASEYLASFVSPPPVVKVVPTTSTSVELIITHQ